MAGVCRYVVCIEHDTLLLQYINASTQRLTLFMCICAAVCDNVTRKWHQRASLVTNVVFAAIFEGMAIPHFMLQKTVMACMCNCAMLVAMIMPWPQSACMPMHGSCGKLPCVPLAQHASSSLSTPSQ